MAIPQPYTTIFNRPNGSLKVSSKSVFCLDPKTEDLFFQTYENYRKILSNPTKNSSHFYVTFKAIQKLREELDVVELSGIDPQLMLENLAEIKAKSLCQEAIDNLITQIVLKY